MAQSLTAPIAVRPRRRLAALLLPLAVAALAAGCSHRRQSMRPVYLSPAPAAAGCVGAGCPSTGSPTVVTPGASSEPALDPITPTSASPLDSGPAPELRVPSLDSPPPVASPGPPPAGRSGKSGGSSDEPGLELQPADPDSSSKVSPKSGGSTSGLNGNGGGSGKPSASRSKYGTGLPAGASAPTRRVRQASLREEVRPYVNDPDDLFAPPKADRPWKYIVLHHSASEAGSYAEIDKEHRKRLGWDGCGYHFVIGNGTESPDGQIEVAQRWVSQKHGVHCRDGKNSDVNEYGIGICLVGDLDQQKPTEKQIAAARALVAYLSDRYEIPAAHTETHAHVATSPTACPGRLFPAQAILGTRGVAVR